MKKIYLLIGALCLLGSANAQNSTKKVKVDRQPLSLSHGTHQVSNLKQVHALRDQAKGDGPDVYFSEDFGNGFDSPNGMWTTEGDQGDLWFHTFPQGSENGYDPEEINNENYSAIANWWGAGNTIQSATQDNGFMMLDADAFNSTATSPDDDPGANTLDNPIEAYLVSPPIDLTGVSGASLTFAHSYRMCCLFANMNLYAEMTVDGGDTWVPAVSIVYDETQIDDQETTVVQDVTDILAGATDIENVQIRFHWPFGPNGQDNLTNSHYFWMIDDLAITQIPDNDLRAGTTFYNNYHDLAEAWDNSEIADEDYVASFEYRNQPNYSLRPFNYAMEVENVGAVTQTGVVLEVSLEDPDGNIETFTSDPAISIDPGESTTIFINDVVPDFFADPTDGLYVSDFQVLQDQNDFNPIDNVGTARGMRISSDGSEGAIFQNGITYTGSFPDRGNDHIWGQRYKFTENQAANTVITHVEFVLLNSEGFAESQPGEIMFVNVREGSIFDDEDNSFVYFGDDDLEYEGDDIEYETNEDELYDGGNTLNWVSFELPNPVLVDPDEIYTAEFRVPIAGGDIIFPTLAGNGEENGGNVFYDFQGDGWNISADASAFIRFRTNSVLSVDEVSVEEGIELVQNYPNPLTDETRISFRLQEPSEIALEIRDIAGKLVDKEVLGLRPEGVTNYDYNASDLSSGAYMYSILTDKGSVTRKMIVE